MRLSALVLGVLLAVSGCALRPRYNDFITKQTTGKEARFVVIDTDTNKPVVGAKVEVSENKNRIIATSDAEGTFVLPVEKKYLDENSLFIVTLPKGVTSYKVLLHKAVEPAPVAPVETPAPVEVAPVVDATDAGVPASN